MALSELTYVVLCPQTTQRERKPHKIRAVLVLFSTTLPASRIKIALNKQFFELPFALLFGIPGSLTYFPNIDSTNASFGTSPEIGKLWSLGQTWPAACFSK